MQRLLKSLSFKDWWQNIIFLWKLSGVSHGDRDKGKKKTFVFILIAFLFSSWDLRDLAIKDVDFMCLISILSKSERNVNPLLSSVSNIKKKGFVQLAKIKITLTPLIFFEIIISVIGFILQSSPQFIVWKLAFLELKNWLYLRTNWSIKVGKLRIYTHFSILRTNRN